MINIFFKVSKCTLTLYQNHRPRKQCTKETRCLSVLKMLNIRLLFIHFSTNVNWKLGSDKNKLCIVPRNVQKPILEA